MLTVIQCFAQQDSIINNDLPGQPGKPGKEVVAAVAPDTALDSTPDSAPDSAADSLQLSLLRIGIRKAKLHVEQSGFWHRITPQIHLSASFGIKDIFFTEDLSPYIFPKDAYRLTASLSISDIFDFAKQNEARSELEKAETEYELVRQQQESKKMSAQSQIVTLDELITLLDEELSIKKDIAAFDQLRFNQGKLGYDAMLNSRMNVIEARRSLMLLHQKKFELSGDRTSRKFRTSGKSASGISVSKP